MKWTKFLNTIIYYILLLSGLVYISWIIWSKFIRERSIREIPDYLLNEYRFWILLYICIIYLYTIKNLIKPKTKQPLLDSKGQPIPDPKKGGQYLAVFDKPRKVGKALRSLMEERKDVQPYLDEHENKITSIIENARKKKSIQLPKNIGTKDDE